MTTRIISQRYADAFFDCIPDDRKEPIESALKMIVEVYLSEPGIKRLLTAPVITYKKKFDILQKILGQIEPPEEIADFLGLLLKKGRIVLLPEIVTCFHTRLQNLKNCAVAEVRTAFKLTEAQKGQIKVHLEKVTGKDLEIVEVIDGSLLAGIVVKINDDLYDFSVRNNLTMLRSRMMGVAS